MQMASFGNSIRKQMGGDGVAHPSGDEGRKAVERKFEQACLLALNRYAWGNGLIAEETYRKMVMQIHRGDEIPQRELGR